MPQLDYITWFPQVLWMIIIFSVLYTVLLKHYSPLSFKSINLRHMKVENHINSTVFYDYMNVEVLYKQWFYLKKLIN
jgi:hypothetical protein